MILPLLIYKLFGYRKFSETQHRRVPLRNFSALWDKKFSTENLDTTPPPLIQTFSVPEINATVKDFPTEISGTVRQKIFDGKSWYSPPLSINFFATGNFWSTAEKGSPAKFFGTVRQKIFVGKSWHSLPPDSKINLFATGNFLKHSTEGFLYEMFRYCKTKNFRRKIVT